MDTQNLNKQEKKQPTKSTFASKIGSMATSAGFGAAGAEFVNRLTSNEVAEDIDGPSTGIVDNQEQNIVEADTTGHTEELPSDNLDNGQVAEPTTEPEPIVTNNDDEILDAEIVQDDVQNSQVNNTNTEPVTTVEQQTTPENVINPDELADAIIAEDQIDPNDIDAADIIKFNEIGTVYTVDGESYIAASFNSPDGEELLMVDVDGDEIFDVITTTNGEIIADAGSLTLGDAQIMVDQEPTYIAQSEHTADQLPTGESYLDDVINS